MQAMKCVFHRFKLFGSRSMSLKVRIDLEKNCMYDIGDLDPYKNQIINLLIGAPGPHLLKYCCDGMKIATEHRMVSIFEKFESKNNAFLFQYGPAVGIHDVRLSLAKFLTTHYDSLVHPSDLVVTSGASIGLHVIISTLVDMSGVIFVDELSYMFALDTIKQYTNMTIVPVPLAESGPDIDKLEQLIVMHKFKTKPPKLFWGMYYTTTIFHNPTGKVFSHHVCQALIKMARQHDILITCDDVYNLLNYSKNKYNRLYLYDNIHDADFKGNVISNGTFSKFFSPGLRLGWMECPPWCIQILRNSGFLDSGGCLNNYSSAVMASMIKLGLLENVMKVQANNYMRNMNTACELLQRHLPHGCRFTVPTGGYFLWIKLPKQINSQDFFKFSKDNYKVVAFPGEAFSIMNKYTNFIRISIAFYETDMLAKGITLLCTALNEFLSKA